MSRGINNDGHVNGSTFNNGGYLGNINSTPYMNFDQGVNPAYVMIVSDECQRSVASNSSSMGMNSMSLRNNDSMVMHTINATNFNQVIRNTGSQAGVGQSHNKFKKTYGDICDSVDATGILKISVTI
ncbi:hypothetical protein FXO38_32638 [Capsicum annuum]|nr:hypothetical protein FXO38_32638 [Capsicum annuum]